MSAPVFAKPRHSPPLPKHVPLEEYNDEKVVGSILLYENAINQNIHGLFFLTLSALRAMVTVAIIVLCWLYVFKIYDNWTFQLLFKISSIGFAFEVLQITGLIYQHEGTGEASSGDILRKCFIALISLAFIAGKVFFTYLLALLFDGVVIAYQNEPNDTNNNLFIGLFLNQLTIHSLIEFSYSLKLFSLLIVVILAFKAFVSYGHYSLLVKNHAYQQESIIALVAQREYIILTFFSILSIPFVFVVSHYVNCLVDDQDSIFVVKKILHVGMAASGILSARCIVRGVWGLWIYSKKTGELLSRNMPIDAKSHCVALLYEFCYNIFASIAFVSISILQFNFRARFSILLHVFCVILVVHVIVSEFVSTYFCMKDSDPPSFLLDENRL